MLTAAAIMERQVVTLSPDQSLLEAGHLLLERGINAAPVVDPQGHLVGMVGLKDVLRAPSPSLHEARLTRYVDPAVQAERAAGITVRSVMARIVVQVTPETPVGEVIALLVNRGRHPLPVVAHGRVVGVIGRADAVRAMLTLWTTRGAATEAAPEIGPGGPRRDGPASP